MGYASKSGRAHTNPSNPQAFAICDRCNFTYNHVNLRWQMDWRGTSLQNIRLLVCDTCYDTPQDQLRAIVVPADPVPIQNPRTFNYAVAETNYVFAQNPSTTAPFVGIPVPQGNDLATESNVNITTQPVGPPLGLDPNGIMPLKDILFFDVLLDVASITTFGTDVVTVTCNTPHNLVTNSQVAITGTSNNQIMGFYSVKVLNPIVFTYEIIPVQNVVPGSWFTATTRVATCSVGLPYDYLQIPIIGIGNYNGNSVAYQFINNLGQPVYFQENNGNIAYWYFNQ